MNGNDNDKALYDLVERLKTTLGLQNPLFHDVVAALNNKEKALQAARSQIARAERLQLAGTVVAQIAHDFRNLLAPLIMLPHIIRRGLQEHDPNHDHLKEIERAAKDMVQMTSDLCALSTRGQTEYEMVNLNDVVEQVVCLVNLRASAKQVEVRKTLATDLLIVRGAPDQLVRTVQNLAENALDAMKHGGVLTVKTANVYLDEPAGTKKQVTIGEYVLVTVSDTGEGIPDDIRERIFEPFFTTKRTPTQRSSGLGLSIVRSMVQDHGGFVDLESQPGHGTSFYIYLPVCRETGFGQSTTGDIRGGDETVLIVDDDLQQVELIALLLTSLGYRVDGVQSGEDALRHLKAKPADLVVIDVVMPGMDGAETLKHIRKTNPAQHIVVVSGFDRSHALDKIRQQETPVFIQKPVSLEEIARAVRQELDRPVGVHKR